MSNELTSQIRQTVFESTTRRNVIGFLTIGAVLAAVPLFVTPSLTRLITQMLIFGIFAIGFDFLYGYSGVVSFGHAAFFGLGAYLFSIPIAQFGFTNVWLLFGLAVLGVAVIAFLISLTLVRTQDTYFSILTLIWALVISLIIENLNITGSHDGFVVMLPEVTVIPGMTVSFYAPQNVYYLALVGLGISFLLLRRLVNSPMGEVLKGGKENADRLRYIGYDERKFRTIAFTVSCGVAGLAGALQATSTGYVSPSVMEFLLSGEVIIWTIIGGAGTLIGPIIGAAAITLIEDTLSEIIGWWQIPVSVLFILILIYMPEGVVGKVSDLRDWYIDRKQ